MDDEIIAELMADANRGIAALKLGQADQASIHFTSALTRAQDVVDDRKRLEEFSTLSRLFERCGFPDLALMAAEDAVDLGQVLGLGNQMAQDIIGVGNAHLKLGNTAKAEDCYRRAIAIFMEQNDLANAAAANTNLAGIIANRGDMPQAIDLLETSLAYVAKEPFDHTEIQTRFALLQALEFEERDVDRAVENARQLCSRLFDQMPAIQQEATLDFVGKAVARYLAAHPDIDARSWKAQNFPML